MPEFEEHRFDDAQSFLDALRLSNKKTWQPDGEESADSDWQRDWIFRGHGSATWKLLPSAWRSISGNSERYPLSRLKHQLWNGHQLRESVANIPINLHQYAHPDRRFSPGIDMQLTGRLERLLLQGLAEYSLVKEFTKLSDELGFPVTPLIEYESIANFVYRYSRLYFPQAIRQSGDLLKGIPSAEIKQQKLTLWANQMVALAQHHSIPTRLLDWTRNPLTAAFFAAKDVSGEKSDDQIVVFTLHKKLLTGFIRLVEVPSGSNDFLRAQAGLFTIDFGAEEFLMKYGRYPLLDDSIKLLEITLEKHEQPKKLMLPTSEAAELMRLLWLERVTHAHLMPTLDHVAEAVQAKVRLSDNLDIMKNWK